MSPELISVLLTQSQQSFCIGLHLHHAAAMNSTQESVLKATGLSTLLSTQLFVDVISQLFATTPLIVLTIQSRFSQQPVVVGKYQLVSSCSNYVSIAFYGVGDTELSCCTYVFDIHECSSLSCRASFPVSLDTVKPLCDFQSAEQPYQRISPLHALVPQWE